MRNIELANIKKKIDNLYCCMTNYYNTNFNKNAVGLYGDNFGLAIFLHLYGRTFETSEAQETANLIIEETMKSPLIDKYPSFASGLVGDCFALILLQKKRFIDSVIDSQIHDYLFKELMFLIKNNTKWDLLHGFLGYALYFLEDKSFGKCNQEALHTIVATLYQKAEINEDICKFRRIFVRPGDIKSVTIYDNYDISLSHGMTGIILVLLKIYERNIARDLTKELIFKSINYVLTTQIKGRSHCLFPSSVRSGKPQPSRLAWCYGDLNVGWCLWKAGKVFGDTYWLQNSLRIFHNCARRRTAEETSVIDAGFCHGSAGLAYFFKRIYEETGDEVFWETAEFWLSDLLKKNVFKDSMTGYKSYYLGKWYESYSLLEGVTGIGLVLMSFLGDNDFWNKFFLLD